MFESIILKSLLGDGEFFNKTIGILKSDYFKSFGDQQVFKLIKEYYSKYHQKPQNVSLVAMVKDVPNEETRKSIIESLKKVSETELNTNTQFMCDETVKFIKSAIFYKGLEVGSDGLMNKDESKMKKAQSIMEEMNKVQIDSDLGLDFDDLDKQIEYYSKREFGIKTQHKSLNKRLGAGFLPGTLNVILAAQGVGKSLLMCDLISGMLLDNKNILLVSLEMSQNEMLKRIQSNVFNIDVNSFRDLSKTQGELQGLERPFTTKEQVIQEYDKVKASGKCGKLFIKEYPAGSMGASILQDLVDKFYTEKNIKFDIIFIDYLGIMKSDLMSPNSGLYSYVKSIGEEVRAFAVRNSVPVISAGQLNRGSINKTDGVDNSAISDSLGTAMTSDFMAFLIQNEQMKTNSEVIIKITKNRYTGMTDTFMMNVDYPKMRFKEILQNEGQPENALTQFATTQQKADAEREVKSAIIEDNKANNQIAKEHDKKVSQGLSSDELNALLGL